MPALQVGGVPELVHLEVALSLDALLGRREQDHAVDDRLLDPEATDLAGAVGDIGGEEANRLVVLNDAGKLEGLLPG